MDWDRIAGNWKQVTGKVKEQWGKLTDDELTEINGNREQLEGKIQNSLRICQGSGSERSRRLDCPSINTEGMSSSKGTAHPTMRAPQRN